MQWPPRPVGWGGVGWDSRDLEGPRSEHWRGSPGQITLGRLQITERLFINFKRNINTNIEIFNSGKVLVMGRMLFFLSEGFVIVT